MNLENSAIACLIISVCVCLCVYVCVCMFFLSEWRLVILDRVVRV